MKLVDDINSGELLKHSVRLPNHGPTLSIIQSDICYCFVEYKKNHIKEFERNKQAACMLYRYIATQRQRLLSLTIKMLMFFIVSKMK